MCAIGSSKTVLEPCAQRPYPGHFMHLYGIRNSSRSSRTMRFERSAPGSERVPLGSDGSTIYNAEWSPAHVPRMSQRFYLLTSAHQHMLVFDAPLNRRA